MAKQSKGRKVGRNAKWCQAYQASGTQKINQAKRLARHLRRYPEDKPARRQLEQLVNVYGKRTGVNLSALPTRIERRYRKNSRIVRAMLRREANERATAAE
jgi:hypothetical protein